MYRHSVGITCTYDEYYRYVLPTTCLYGMGNLQDLPILYPHLATPYLQCRTQIFDGWTSILKNTVTGSKSAYKSCKTDVYVMSFSMQCQIICHSSWGFTMNWLCAVTYQSGIYLP